MGMENQNVDPVEIEKFEALASRWWDRTGEFKALHDINGLRIGYIRSRTDLAGKTVVDAGCGGGILSEALAVAGAHVTGIDMGEAPLAAARHHQQQAGLSIDYRQTTAELLAEAVGGSFDRVVCFELIEHVPEPKSVVAACSDLVKPGGDIFFATLNRNIKSFIFAIFGAEYLLGLVPRGTHSFSRFIKPSELSRWAGDVGLKLQDMTGLHYNPFFKKYSIGGNLNVNYFAHFIK
jgi:2-polyprenyl-6-hydroxyphenyl methylase / 3-demethylubiquinone-9 3-methyltransferase